MLTIKKNGLKVSGKSCLTVHPNVLLDEGDVEEVDLLLLTVKAYDTENILHELKPYIGDAVLLTLQNGIGNLEAIRSVLPETKIFLGITTHGVTFVAPGHVHHAGIGTTKIGDPSAPPGPFINQIAENFTSCGIETAVAKDILREVWLKAVINASINPLTALLGVKNGELLEPQLLEVCRRVCKEAAEVSKHYGFEYEEPFRAVLEVIRHTAENKSSMLQDVEKGRKTEAEAILGSLVRAGAQKGISTPLLSFLYRAVLRYEHLSSKVH